MHTVESYYGLLTTKMKKSFKCQIKLNSLSSENDI